MHFRLALAFPLTLLLAPLPSQEEWTPGELFDAVSKVMGRSYFDREFRRDRWPALVDTYRPAALAAADLDEERAVVQALLGNVPATHLSLYSKATHQHLLRELSKREAPTFGCELEQIGGRFFVTGLLEGGPAAGAGLRRGDQVLAIDGEPVGGNRRLDRSSDDAYLPDRPRHQILCAGADDEVRLRVRRTPEGAVGTIAVPAATWSAWRAAEASVRTLDVDGVRVGYVHYWFIHMGGVATHFRGLLEERFSDCAAIVLDLRGRGGDGSAVEPLVQAVRDAGRPVVALIDAGTRSAKEVIAYRLREDDLATLVGEHTACAVIPASFQKVGDDDVLMYPSFTLGRFTTAIELQGVPPHVPVADALPFAGGADPILEAGLATARQRGS